MALGPREVQKLKEKSKELARFWELDPDSHYDVIRARARELAIAAGHDASNLSEDEIDLYMDQAVLFFRVERYEFMSIQKATVIGDGGMGSVCAMLLCDNGIATTLWGHNPEQLADIAEAGENIYFLPGHPLPKSLEYEADDTAAEETGEVAR